MFQYRYALAGPNKSLLFFADYNKNTHNPLSTFFQLPVQYMFIPDGNSGPPTAESQPKSRVFYISVSQHFNIKELLFQAAHELRTASLYSVLQFYEPWIVFFYPTDGA